MAFFIDWVSLLLTFIFLAILFTTTFSHLSSPDPFPSAKPKILEAPPRYLAEFKVTRALREEMRRRERGNINPIPFMTLPDEIKIKILSHSSEPDSIEAFRMLLRVTKQIRYMTLQSCLPLLRIVLNSRKSIQSFYTFCLNNPDLARCVHHVWVSPPSEEDRYQSCSIIKTCENLRTLACSASMLVAAVCSESRLKHEHCKNFTLLNGSELDWENTLPKRAASAFFGRLTHLHITGESIPRTIQCKKITHLSYVCRLGEREASLKRVLEDVKQFPRLRSLLLNQEARWTAVDVIGGKWRQYSTPSNVKDLDLWMEGRG